MPVPILHIVTLFSLVLMMCAEAEFVLNVIFIMYALNSCLGGSCEGRKRILQTNYIKILTHNILSAKIPFMSLITNYLFLSQ